MPSESGIEALLSHNGLGEYAELLAANKIGLDVLPDLTDVDLKELGIPLGDRKRLLKAFKMLAAAPAVAGPVEATGPSSSLPQAERRQLTVMFVDLVGSTALSARLDPEELREALRVYQDVVAATIARVGGHVAKFLGDGVLAYFGWPKAHEDDAERAVRAGLAIVDEVHRLRTRAGELLEVRIGIATGLVVVGDLLGEGAAREETVVGKTPNLAARLQQIAAPGSVVIAESTRRLLGSTFELEALNPGPLKGLGEVVPAFRVLAERHVRSRFEAHQKGVILPLVGRERELALLLEWWRLARAGQGQAVLLVGEPGIGKSRIAKALADALVDGPHATIRYQCSPYHADSPLWPVIEQLGFAAEFAPGDDDTARRRKLETLLRPWACDATEAVALLAPLLGIEPAGSHSILDLTPQQRRARMLAALVDHLANLGAEQPTPVLFEDVHWIDPTSLEFVEQVLERIAGSRILMLLTSRPDNQPPLEDRPHLARLTLERLGREASSDIIRAISHGKPLPPELEEMIAIRTDGVPLFVEELTKMVLESGLLRDTGDAFALTGPLPPLAIPTTLHASLMARLDRLAPVKEVAQIGAVIGREFSYELLAVVADMPGNQLVAALDELVTSELVHRHGAPPQAAYRFKHMLVRDAAYESLLKGRRQQLHARIASALEEQFPAAAEAQPELLARHCTEAGLIEKAVGYWWRAGQLASGRSALAEAIGHFRRALELVPMLPDPSVRAEREIELQTALGGTLIAAKGHAAPETGQAYARARDLCRRIGDTGRLLPLLFGQWVFHMVRAEHSTARDLAEELLRSAERQGEAAGLVVGHRAVGIGALWRGEPGNARRHLEQTLALYDPAGHRSLASLYAYDPKLAGLAGLACALFQLGYPEQAVARCREAVEEARQLSHPAGLAYALHHACTLDQARGDSASVREQATMLVALAADQVFPFWQAAGMMFEGWVLAKEGRAVEGIARLANGLTAYQGTGAALSVPYYLALSGEAHAAAGRVTEGLSLLAEALAEIHATGERWFEAELHRLKGKLLLRLAREDRGAAEACFLRAGTVARDQEAKLWELRAGTSLACLQAEQGRRQEAYDLLAPVYDWFSEGFDTPDLIEAKQLLEALA
jgi:predicted ATPase/class 3 adenylate cyclase